MKVSKKIFASVPIMLSFLLHVGAFVSFFFASQYQSTETVNKPMEVVLLQKEFVEKIKAAHLVKRQVVESEQIGRQEKDLNSRFLGKADQVHDRQTVAQHIDKFNVGGKQQAKEVAKSKNKIKLKQLALSPSLELAKFVPPTETGDKGKGISSSNDFVEDVQLGDFTRLNTQEFKFYGFYNRIKQRLEEFWGDTLRQKAEALYRSGRRMPASENAVTGLRIYLDSKGNIVRIKVNAPSGVREFDDAAVEAFNRAGPFPNPPRGMIKNGHAVLEWGFVVKG